MKTQKLIAAEQAVEDINGMNYTQASAAVLQAAYDMPEDTEAEADAKADAIQAAISGLVPVDDQPDQPKKTDKKKGFNKNWLWLLLLLLIPIFFFLRGDGKVLELTADPTTGAPELTSHITIKANFDKGTLDYGDGTDSKIHRAKGETGTATYGPVDHVYADTGVFKLTVKGFWGTDTLTKTVMIHVTIPTTPGTTPTTPGTTPTTPGTTPTTPGTTPTMPGTTPTTPGTQPVVTTPSVITPGGGTITPAKPKQKLPYHYTVINGKDTTKFQTKDTLDVELDGDPRLIKNFVGQTGAQTKFEYNGKKFDLLKGYTITKLPNGKYHVHGVGGDEPAINVGRKYKVKYN